MQGTASQRASASPDMNSFPSQTRTKILKQIGCLYRNSLNFKRSLYLVTYIIKYYLSSHVETSSCNLELINLGVINGIFSSVIRLASLSGILGT
jgi:hypothetical protein